MANYMEIQDFVELPYTCLLRFTWNDTENVLENGKNILEKVLEKCLNIFLETCTHHVRVASGQGKAREIFFFQGQWSPWIL